MQRLPRSCRSPLVRRPAAAALPGPVPIAGTSPSATRPARVALVFAVAWLGTACALAQGFDARALAASCASCHQPGQSLPPPLAGRARAELLERLEAFRSGAREGTVMPQLARGYTTAELQAIAQWYAARSPADR